MLLTEHAAILPGYESVSVLSKHSGLAPLRIGFWRQKAPGKPPGYIPDTLLCAVEPPAAQLLELSRLAAFGDGLTYAPSRNRQCHLYAVTQRSDSRSLALKRVFVRSVLPCAATDARTPGPYLSSPQQASEGVSGTVQCCAVGEVLFAFVISALLTMICLQGPGAAAGQTSAAGSYL